MFQRTIQRRDFLKMAGTGALCLGSAGWSGLASPQGSVVPEIRTYVNYDIGRYFFDPMGLYVEPGQTVRWQVGSTLNHAVTAYHPTNANHEQRIPDHAAPFDSAQLLLGGTFEWTFKEPGTYDYYCGPHEGMGMVGRIVVGAPGGPGERPVGYGAREGRRVMYQEVVRTFAVIDSKEIVRQKSIPYPVGLLRLRFPLHRSP